MRTVQPFLLAFLCAGTMFVCFRMMSGKHHSTAATEPKSTFSSEPQTEARAPADR